MHFEIKTQQRSRTCFWKAKQVIIFSPAQQKAVADGKVCPEDRRGSRCYVSERVPVDQPEEGGEGEEGEEGGGEREQDRHQPDYL